VPLRHFSLPLSSYDARGKHSHRSLLQLLQQSPLLPCVCGRALALSLPGASHADHIYIYIVIQTKTKINHYFTNKGQLMPLKIRKTYKQDRQNIFNLFGFLNYFVLN
jgi:hypothetical protein